MSKKIEMDYPTVTCITFCNCVMK